MRILVSGAGGFVGANLVRFLSERGHEVHGTVRPDGSDWRLRDANVQVHHVDLRDPSLTAKVAHDVRPDSIVHAAAHGAYSWQRDPGEMTRINIESTHCLLEAAETVGVERFVHLGSSSEYGIVDHPPSETEALSPNSLYAITKAAATHLVCDAARSGRVDGVVLRLYSVYGPWEEPDRLLPTVALWATRGRLPPRLVDPLVARDFVHVDDVCHAVIRALEADLAGLEPRILNIGSGVQTTIGELISLTRQVFGITAEPNWGTMDRRSWDATTWLSDPRLARETLQWSTTVGLADGLADLARFVDSHRDHYVSDSEVGGV